MHELIRTLKPAPGTPPGLPGATDTSGNRARHPSRASTAVPRIASAALATMFIGCLMVCAALTAPALAESRATATPAPARHVVVMLLQEELLVEQRELPDRYRPREYRAHLPDWKEVVLGLAAITTYAATQTVLMDNTLSAELDLPPGEFDMGRGLLSAITAQFPANFVAPDAKVHLTYGIPSYARARRQLAGESLLGMTVTYTLGADLRTLSVSAQVDLGITGKGHPRPQMAGFAVTLAQPGTYLEGIPAAPGRVGYWLDRGGVRLRQAVLKAGRELGRLVANDYLEAVRWTRKDERQLTRLRLRTAEQPLLGNTVGVIEDRGSQVLISDKGERKLVDRALLPLPEPAH